MQVQEEAMPVGVIKQLIYGYSDATNIDANVVRHYMPMLNTQAEIVLAEHIKSEQYSYHLSTIKYPEIIKKFNLYIKNNAHIISQLKNKHNINN